MICGGDAVDPCQAHFLYQAVLQCFEQSFDPSLACGLRAAIHSIFCSNRKVNLRFDLRPRNPCITARSPCSRRRNSSRRIWRSLIFSRLAAAICVICFCWTSCSTRNLSRSRWLKAIRSVSIYESGHFYFAQTGHSHFAATLRDTLRDTSLTPLEAKT
jgi:hypothetical protein